MERPKTCMWHGSKCPFDRKRCDGCGWDKHEDIRRHNLPLVVNERTGLSRKIVGRAQADEAAR